MSELSEVDEAGGDSESVRERETTKRVLDHGYITLVDTLGNDLTPAAAARVSYVSKSRGWDEGDGKLTSFLYDHGHTSPFEMVECVFEVQAPIFVTRQWFRHRTASINEFSMRYAEPGKLNEIEDTPLFYIPDRWRLQDKVNKQSSSEEYSDLDTWSYEVLLNNVSDMYKFMIARGISREQARILLPVSTYTRFIWKCDLRNIFHFLNLRTEASAQYEIRQYAVAMVEILEEKFPHLMKIWKEGKAWS